MCFIHLEDCFEARAFGNDAEISIHNVFMGDGKELSRGAMSPKRKAAEQHEDPPTKKLKSTNETNQENNAADDSNALRLENEAIRKVVVQQTAKIKELNADQLEKQAENANLRVTIDERNEKIELLESEHKEWRSKRRENVVSAIADSETAMRRRYEKRLQNQKNEFDARLQDQTDKVKAVLQKKDDVHAKKVADMVAKQAAALQAKEEAAAEKHESNKQLCVDKVIAAKKKATEAMAENKAIKEQYGKLEKQLKREHAELIKQTKAKQKEEIVKQKPEHSQLIKQKNSELKNMTAALKKVNEELLASKKDAKTVDDTTVQLKEHKQALQSIINDKDEIISAQQLSLKTWQLDMTNKTKIHEAEILDLHKQLVTGGQRWQVQLGIAKQTALDLVDEKRRNLMLVGMSSSRDERIKGLTAELEEVKTGLAGARELGGAVDRGGVGEEHEVLPTDVESPCAGECEGDLAGAEGGLITTEVIE
ncbi:hypothetical protein LTR62_008789 [Meristemomyces frigidus]|uniref:Uncharacterized protein n=1 Tax=Meristemomyces frigidus TaxID=1508187 RepID=A0AAN7TAI0_9PEZI|nr:hypothetical protein LTR62_008789 [Meristemomyces frigidus]